VAAHFRETHIPMNTAAILLTLSSTFFHAGWNLLARKERSEHTFLLRAIFMIAAVGFIPAMLGFLILPPWPPRTWLCAGLTSLFCGTYFFALARAYGYGDFTVVYPVARSLPVLLVPLGDVLRGHPLTTLGWLGVALVATVCIFMPLHSLREIRRKHYLNRAMPWIILAAIGTTGYSITDKIAMDAVSAATGGGLLQALLYGYCFYSFSTVIMLLLCAIFGRRGENPSTVGWRKPALAGLLTYGSYGLILWAYQLADHAGYVVAFRQFSILIGVVIAIFWFREKGAPLRFTAACVMLVGLILIGAFGK